MSNPVKPIPDGYHSITPSLVCKNASRAIEFYKKVLGAEERMRMAGPDGKIGHAELKIGDSIVFISDEFPAMGNNPPKAGGSVLFLYVKDADAVFKAAVAAGAQADMPLENQFWGDRYGKVTDPFGHQWGIATHVEDVSPDEMDRRSKEFAKKMAAGQS